VKIAVLVSGGGTNLQAIIDAVKTKKIKNAKLVLVLSNNPDAYAVARGDKAGIETLVLSEKNYRSRLEHAKALVKELKKRKIDLICLAGFMVILIPYFIRHFKTKILNIHPALLPAFGGPGMYGHHVHEAVIAAKEEKSGITIHFVNEKYDQGDILFQADTLITPDDTPESLAEKIHQLEYRYFPEIIESLL